MWKLLITVKIIAILVMARAWAQPVNPLFKKLAFGDHSVGYQLIKAYDRGRSPLHEQLTLPEDQQIGRAVPIYLWYPSDKGLKGRHLNFQDYMDHWAYAWDYEIDPDSITLEAKHQFSNYYWHFSDENIDEYFNLSIPTKAVEDAPPAEGKFPLVVFSHGHLDKWWIWGEYLASHGFAVVGTPNAGAHQKRHEVGLIGLEAQIRDSEFALSVLANYDFVNTRSIVAAGSSYGSLSATGLASRNGNVKGVISLDGIIADWNEGELLQRTPYWDYQFFDTPIFHAHSNAVYSSNYIWMEQMRYTDQYRLLFSDLRHADYHFQGMADLFGFSFNDSEIKDSSVSFGWLTQYALQFIKGVTQNPTHLKFLSNTPEQNGVPEGSIQVELKMGLPATYSSSYLVALVRQEGFVSLNNLYHEIRATNPQPFSPLTFYDVGIMLHRLNLIEEEKTWFGYYLESYPQSAEAMYRLGRLESVMGNKEKGKDRLKTAQKLIEQDPYLNQDRKEYLESRINQFLEN